MHVEDIPNLLCDLAGLGLNLASTPATRRIIADDTTSNARRDKPLQLLYLALLGRRVAVEAVEQGLRQWVNRGWR